VRKLKGWTIFKITVKNTSVDIYFYDYPYTPASFKGLKVIILRKAVVSSSYSTFLASY
jgi:hypothetical protein